MVNQKILICFVIFGFVISGCGPTQVLDPTEPPASPSPPTSTVTLTATLLPTSTPTEIPTQTATYTHTPSQTPSLTPTPTPLPGSVVIPVDTLGKQIPWLPLDDGAIPGVNYVGFNIRQAPFDNVLVRRAFALAVDRQVLVEMAARYHTPNPRPATSLTPPETLGRDLYNQVGAGFDPHKAKELFAEAGYTDPATFPTVTFIVNAYGDVAPGARFNMANAMVEMWQTHLGVTVQVEVIASFQNYGNRLRTDPPGLFWQGWRADYNDPDNFLKEIFRSGSQYNFGGFSNATFDQLVVKASLLNNPGQRQELYILAENILCSEEAAVIPLYHSTYK